MVHEKMVQIKERMDVIGEIYNITPNMIELFNEKETSISDRQNQNNILSMFYKMPTQSDIKLNYGN